MNDGFEQQIHESKSKHYHMKSTAEKMEEKLAVLAGDIIVLENKKATK